MAKGELEFDDLDDFFERSYVVSTQSETSWVFTGTSERFDGYTVELIGIGLVGSGDFPTDGTIQHVIITGPGGVTDDVDGLSLAASELASEVDFGDHDGKDVSGDDGDDSLGGKDGDDDLLGGGGDDSLKGKGGDDFLSGDDGDDDLKGQGGDDEIHGGFGDDKIVGGGGKDDL